jgi:hypothetical protein
MIPSSIDEHQRTSPLALWRYAHDYLCVANDLCDRLMITSAESQAPYHLAAQGIEFALKSYLRTRGATMTDLRHEVGHSLAHALERSEALGLPPLPAPLRSAIVGLAPFHQEHQFVFLALPDDTYPQILPLLDAGIWILDCIAPDVVDHFVAHLGTDATPPAPEFVRRLRAALSVTSGSAAARATAVHDTARTYGSTPAVDAWRDAPPPA